MDIDGGRGGTLIDAVLDEAAANEPGPRPPATPAGAVPVAF